MSIVSPATLEAWRQQASSEPQPRAERCSSCRHLRPLPLPRPGIYLGPHGHCGLVGLDIDYAHVTRCDGWQDDIGPRRERVEDPAEVDRLHALATEACQRLRKIAVKHKEHKAKAWANENAPPTRKILRGHGGELPATRPHDDD